eukprot:gene6867-7982_t
MSPSRALAAIPLRGAQRKIPASQQSRLLHGGVNGLLDMRSKDWFATVNWRLGGASLCYLRALPNLKKLSRSYGNTGSEIQYRGNETLAVNSEEN